MKCSDGINRTIFPRFLILSQDLEEAYVLVHNGMLLLRFPRYLSALVHGVNSHYPCVRCLVPTDQQHNISHEVPLCTSADAMALLEHADTLLNEGDVKGSEQLLQSKGYYHIKVHV